VWTRRTLLQSGLALGAGLLAPRRALAAGDELRVGLPGEPPGLDPAISNDRLTATIAWGNLFEGLTSVDETGAVIPGLARAWTASPDGLNYTFVLHTEARYHDGTNFDAAHAVFSLNRLLANRGAPDRALYDSIAEVTAVDDATVRLTLGTPDDRLLFNLARGSAAMVAPESADNNARVPIGTGPFAFMQWDAGADIIIVRNEDYWGAHPHFDQVTYSFVPEARVLEALRAKDVDAYPLLPAEATARLAGDPAWQVVSGAGPDGKPRSGAWSSQLAGMWHGAPIEGCPLAAVHWAADSGPVQTGPAAESHDDD
jgi:peptide/nickel transport system substrate-binding protein